jgi:hypothetical protein
MGCLDSSHKRTIAYPVRQTLKMSREAVPNSNHYIQVGTDRQMPLQWMAGVRK